MAALQKPGVQYDIASQDDGAISCVTWTTQLQLDLLKAYPEVIMMDGTYKVLHSVHILCEKIASH